MVQLQFDANRVAPSTAPEPVPNGDYVVMLTKDERKPTSKNDGFYLELSLAVQQGEYAQKVIKARLNLWNASQQAVEIAYGELSAICHVTGVMQFNDTQQLYGRPFIVSVVKEPRNDRPGQFSNNVTGYKDMNGNPPGMAGNSQGGGNPGWAGQPGGNFQQQPQGNQQGGWQGQPQGGNPQYGNPQGQPQGNPQYGNPQGNPQQGGWQGQPQQGNPQGQPSYGQPQHGYDPNQQGGGNFQQNPQGGNYGGNPQQGQPQGGPGGPGPTQQGGMPSWAQQQ